MKITAIQKFNTVVPFKSNMGNDLIKKSLYTAQKLNNIGLHKNTDEEYMNFLLGEIDEFKVAVKNNDRDNMEEEMGDILFDTIMLAKHHDINPIKALDRTNKKINDRIDIMHILAEKPILDYPLQERLDFWQKAKIELSAKEK